MTGPPTSNEELQQAKPMTDAIKAANLLQMARSNFSDNTVSALGLEAMLRLTEGPKTAAQLVAETGCHNGTLIRQLHRYCVRHDAKTDQVIEPQLKLIEREPRAEKLKGHLYRLSDGGWRFLQMAGLTAGTSASNQKGGISYE